MVADPQAPPKEGHRPACSVCGRYLPVDEDGQAVAHASSIGADGAPIPLCDGSGRELVR